MGDNGIREKIIKLLERNPEGMTILNIANSIGINRNTVTKYIYGLSGAGIIAQRKVGSAKLCYLRKSGKGRAGRLKMFSLFVLVSFMFSSVLFSQFAFAATQSHPLSQIDTIDTNLNMTNYGVNITGASLYINASSSAIDKTAFLYMGSSARDGSEYIQFDPALGANGKFLFTAPLQVAGSSPAITFYDPAQPTNYSRNESIIFSPDEAYPINFSTSVQVGGNLNILGASPGTITFGSGTDAESLQYDPDSGFKFSGGQFVQNFANLIRNAGFESYSGGATMSGSEMEATPDGWILTGESYQFSPETDSFGDQTYQGYNSLKLKANSTFTSFVTQQVSAYKLQPGKTYSIGVWVKLNSGGTAKLDVSGGALQGSFTTQSTTLTTWTLLKGQFTVGNTMSDTESITIKLTAEDASGFFDNVQLNIGHALGQFQDPPITGIGLQTIYGGLDLKRTGAGRGGILSVDKAVRTRRIEFSYNDDPSTGGVTEDWFMNSETAAGDFTPEAVYLELWGGRAIGLMSPSQNTSVLRFDIEDNRGVSLSVMNNTWGSGQVMFKSDVNVSQGNQLCLDNSCISAWSDSGMSGSGNAGYLPKYTGATALANSVIYETGSNIGIGTQNPGNYKLSVAGNVRLSSASPSIDMNGVSIRKVGSNIVISDA